MNKESEYINYLINDLLSGIRGITYRAMFGGYGIYKNGVIFAIVADDQLFFKVDDTNQADYEKYDSKPFVYSQGKHKPTAMSYWLLPEEIMEDKDKLRKWVVKAHAINLRKSAK